MQSQNHIISHPIRDGDHLQPNLVWMAQHLSVHNELVMSRETLKKPGRISLSTLKRILKRVGRSEPKLAYRKPKPPPSKRPQQVYPMRKIPGDMYESGHFEVDLVHHCGESAAGEYIHTFQMVVVAMGRSELTAIYGRGYHDTKIGLALASLIPGQQHPNIKIPFSPNGAWVGLSPDYKAFGKVKDKGRQI